MYVGVKSCVNEPTQWCAAMLVIPKPSGSIIIICVHLKSVNESMMQEVHPLHKIDM